MPAYSEHRSLDLTPFDCERIGSNWPVVETAVT